MSDDRIDHVVQQEGQHWLVWLRTQDGIRPEEQATSIVVGMGLTRSEAASNAHRLLLRTLDALARDV